MFSVIIGTHDSERRLFATLASLVAGAAAGILREVIVADAGSSDGTSIVADAAGCRIMTIDAPLAARLRAAAAGARAECLLFLQPGAILEGDWIAEATRFVVANEKTFRQSRAAVFRPVPPRSDRPLLLEAASLVRLSFRLRPDPSQGLVIPKSLYESVGGHSDADTDPETGLLRRIRRSRLVTLRGATVRISD
jgi:glycosyltransferase involved in cell wall biosynthesis